MKKITFILLSSIFLSISCVTVTLSDKIMQIEKGMSKTEVINIMGGSPHNRALERNYEEWEYTYAYSQEEVKVVIIRFKNDKVSGMESFKRIIPRQHKPKQ